MQNVTGKDSFPLTIPYNLAYDLYMSFISSFVDKLIKPAEVKPTTPPDLQAELAKEISYNADLKKQVSMGPVRADLRIVDESDKKIEKIREQIAAQQNITTAENTAVQAPVAETGPRLVPVPGTPGIENFPRPMDSNPTPTKSEEAAA
jgi:hypothetical protein